MSENFTNDGEPLPFVLFPHDVLEIQEFVRPGNKNLAAFADIQGDMATVFMLQYLEKRRDGMDHREAFDTSVQKIEKQKEYYLKHGEPSLEIWRGGENE